MENKCDGCKRAVGADEHHIYTCNCGVEKIEKMYSIDDIEAYCDKYSNDTELGRAIRKLKYKQ